MEVQKYEFEATQSLSLGNSFGNYTASYELPRKKVKFQIQNVTNATK